LIIGVIELVRNRQTATAVYGTAVVEWQRCEKLLEDGLLLPHWHTLLIIPR
jgi:hypothetical protein